MSAFVVRFLLGKTIKTIDGQVRVDFFLVIKINDLVRTSDETTNSQASVEINKPVLPWMCNFFFFQQDSVH